MEYFNPNTIVGIQVRDLNQDTYTCKAWQPNTTAYVKLFTSRDDLGYYKEFTSREEAEQYAKEFAGKYNLIPAPK
jgi:hypothetical protein